MTPSPKKVSLYERERGRKRRKKGGKEGQREIVCVCQKGKEKGREKGGRREGQREGGGMENKCPFSKTDCQTDSKLCEAGAKHDITRLLKGREFILEETSR